MTASAYLLNKTAGLCAGLTSTPRPLLGDCGHGRCSNVIIIRCVGIRQGTAELLRHPAEAARLAHPDRDTGAPPPPELVERLAEAAAACSDADGVYSPRCDAARQAAGACLFTPLHFARLL